MKTEIINQTKKSENRQNVVWLDLRKVNYKKNNLIGLVYNYNFSFILVNRANVESLKAPSKMNLVVEIKKIEELKDIPENCVVFSSSIELLKDVKKKGYKTAFMTTINDENSMNYAWQKGLLYDYLVIELLDSTNIPLELLIAKLQHTNTVLIKKVFSVEDAEIVSGVMEVGSDGLLFETDSMEELLSIDRFIQKQKTGKLKLISGKVINLEHAGMGYRACIDTTSILRENEGMIVGSTSEGGLVVSSETHYLPYMELRPFRVNAGAVHSYVWCPDNQTAYMTELKGGKVVTCLDTEGNTREVTVGRIKTEIRPLLKIEVEAAGKRINAFVQDDWHIRVFGSKGEPFNASEIKVGDELLTYVCDSGRHVGIKIEENIEEK